jgi:hypothetical protein
MLQPTLEERVAHVENDVAELKSKVERLRPGQGWIDKITGSFKDDPDFEEILRLGQEIRQADRENSVGP